MFKSEATNNTKIAFVRDSLEIVNESPITGDVSVPTLVELKQRINDTFKFVSTIRRLEWKINNF